MTFLSPASFHRFLLLAFLVGVSILSARADRVYLRDGSSIQCRILSETTVQGERFYQIQVDSVLVWLSNRAVLKTEKSPDIIRTSEQVRLQLEKMLQEGTAVRRIEDATAMAAQDAAQPALTVQGVKGWAYLYENERAVQSGDRTALAPGSTIPLGQILIVSPNSRVTLAIGDIGRMGLESQTRIRFDQINRNRAQTYELDLVLSGGRFWIQVGELGATWKRVNLVMNTAHVILQQASLYVEAAERAGAIDITYLRGRGDLNFWRATEVPSLVSPGSLVHVSPASNQLAVEKVDTIQPRLDAIQNWDSWQPETLAVNLDVMLPPLRTFPKYPPVPALHPYRIPIDSSMTAPPETRALGQILNLYREACERYKFDTGKFPPPERGVESLFQALDVAGWKGPYVSPDTPRLDLWGNPFVYDLYTVNRKEYVDIRSNGPNGEDDKGLDDDVR